MTKLGNLIIGTILASYGVALLLVLWMVISEVWEVVPIISRVILYDTILYAAVVGSVLFFVAALYDLWQWRDIHECGN